jgi:hypothetical protein
MGGKIAAPSREVQWGFALPNLPINITVVGH